jgi:hypothetical protein
MVLLFSRFGEITHQDVESYRLDPSSDLDLDLVIHRFLTGTYYFYARSFATNNMSTSKAPIDIIQEGEKNPRGIPKAIFIVRLAVIFPPHFTLC